MIDKFLIYKKSGNKNWKFHAGEAVNSSPTIRNGVVYFSSADGKLYLIEKNEEELKLAIQFNE